MKIKRTAGNISFEGSDASLCYVRAKDFTHSKDYAILLPAADVELKAGDSFVIATPGEYELKDILVTSIPSTVENKSSAYVIDVDGVAILIMNTLAADFTNAQVEMMGEIHIVVCDLNPAAIEKQMDIVSEVEPTMFIPISNDKSVVELAAKTLGMDLTEVQASLSVKATDFLDSELPLQLVILS
jgi:hypothetical protein